MPLPPLPWDPRTTIFDPAPLNDHMMGHPERARRPVSVVINDHDYATWKLNDVVRPITQIKPANGGGINAFNVWYLPWADDQTLHTVLDPEQAQIMITGRMDGCTFGVGTSNLRGQTIVTHSNAQSSRDQALGQRTGTLAVMRERNENRPKLVEPKHYRSNYSAILLFGIYSAREDDASAQGRNIVKHFFLNLRTNHQSRPKWRFYQHKFIPGVDPIEPTEFSKRINRLT